MHLSNVTKYNRYPEQFAFARDFNRHLHILSFGCSYGYEVITLHDLYFTQAKITGVDINRDCIEMCKRSIIHPDIEFLMYEEWQKQRGKYDIIFCMSVLLHLDGSLTHDEFDEQVAELDKRLKRGGLLLTENAAFKIELPGYKELRPNIYQKT